MSSDPRRSTRAFTLLEVVVVFLIVALLMLVCLGLIRTKTNPKRDVPPLPDTKKPVLIERDGKVKATPAPAPEGKPGFH